MENFNMNKVKIIGENIPNIPWQDKPAGSYDAVWRYSQNPIIKRDQIRPANSIFNSAVVTWQNGFIGVFRVDHRDRRSRLHKGTSSDGINWNIAEQPITFLCDIDAIRKDVAYGYDPRVVKIENRYWITWCNGIGNRPTIGVAWTEDFETFHQEENAFLPYNRNGVLFPRKINDRYVMLNRPSDNGSTPFGDIFLSQSPDMKYWGEHRLVMVADGHWSYVKVGAGPIPIETSEGWLMIYHGVLNSCSGMLYSAGVALLDLEQPEKVIARSENYILSPWMDYECVGDVPNVVFPCAALCDAATGRIAIYYGAADTVVAMAFTTVDELLEQMKK